MITRDNPLCAAALSLLLIHAESGCPHAAAQAARLLERIAETPEIDATTRHLCERASQRLTIPAEQNTGPGRRYRTRA